MDREQELFIQDFLKELFEENIAVFAGAGLSTPAGVVNWRDLVRPLADELGLNVDLEHDLVSVAQYHFNENGKQRHKINQLLIENIAIGQSPTVNHRILAALPIRTYWTTNYDQLIEASLKNAGKITDVKYTIEHLALTRPRRDTIVYKMHGDVEHPHKAILIKDDYEKYHLTHGAFTNALSGDLISKTFLFLGFSFTDPNLDYVLSRIRTTFREHQRRHYCIFKRRQKEDNETDLDFQHAQIKQRLAVEDLKRFNIKTLLVDDYAEITKILLRIERLYRRRTIFISGSAEAFGNWTQVSVNEFLRELGRTLVERNYRLATGLGLGVGNAIITGAIEQIHKAKTSHIDDALIMRPFPRANPNEAERAQLWEAYRQEIISNAGICVFLFGNKLVDGNIVPADGVRREFQIAQDRGLKLVPIGATGYVAHSLWEEVLAKFDLHYANSKVDLRERFLSLGEHVDDPIKLLPRIHEAIDQIAKE